MFFNKIHKLHVESYCNGSNSVVNQLCCAEKCFEGLIGEEEVKIK